MADPREDALDYHSRGRPGKLEVVPTKPLDTQRDLSLAYTPGVAEACREIHRDPDTAYQLTAKGNLVAVVTNGTAVLGLGDIGPLAGKPVMEGKANLFKRFADIDVFDIELDARTPDEIVAAVKAMAPTFGGINLEDIKAPECFEVERRLQEALDIPVFHDDQHGTAIISAAALLNAAALTERDLAELKLVVSGAGAAAMACARLYCSLGVRRDNVVMCDSRGAIRWDRPNLSADKSEFATARDVHDLADALDGADAFVGLSVGGIVNAEMIAKMAPRPIIMAMANPDPEIPYELAKAARPDAIVATGRSDHPNQVNNVLGFPFVFRGALDCRARKITEEMKIAATRALAALTREEVPETVLRAYGVERIRFGPDYIIPKPFDRRVLVWVAPAVAQAAAASGVARRPIADLEAYREHLWALVERSRGLMLPLVGRARAHAPKRVVLSDGHHPRVLRAAQVLADEGICSPVVLGAEWRVRQRAAAADISLRGVEIVEPMTHPEIDRLAAELWKARQRKGMTLASARRQLADPAWFGLMMLRTGMADGLVAGFAQPYTATIRPALQVLELAPEATAVSGVYAILHRDRKLFLGDCTVTVTPDAERLAAIALNTARVARAFGVEPRIAMLSYSDFGGHHRDERVRVVREAIELVRQRAPSLEIDGEMQAGTALDPDRLANFPFSTLKGPANVLVFPDLTAGNIAYQIAEQLGGADALGPLMVGLGKPIGVIPQYAKERTIVNIATYVVDQALDLARARDAAR